MEVAGLAISVASLTALFTNCVQAWGFLASARSFAHDFSILQTKLEIERTIFLQWGQRMGITTSLNESGAGLDQRIADWSGNAIQGSVFRALLALKKLLSDSEGLRLKYGVTVDHNLARGDEEELPERLSQSPMRAFEAWQSKIRAHQNEATIWKKTRWVCKDRDRFTLLIEEIAYFNTKLDSLTPPPPLMQQFLVQSILQGLRDDIQLLRLVQNASDSNREEWSDRATEYIEATDMSSTQPGEFEHIQQWRNNLPGSDQSSDVISSTGSSCSGQNTDLSPQDKLRVAAEKKLRRKLLRLARAHARDLDVTRVSLRYFAVGPIRDLWCSTLFDEQKSRLAALSAEIRATKFSPDAHIIFEYRLRKLLVRDWLTFDEVRLIQFTWLYYYFQDNDQRSESAARIRAKIIAAVDSLEDLFHSLPSQP